MDNTILRIFQPEVERQCKFAIIAAEDLARALKSLDMDGIWYSIQVVLVAAGNTSKLLWPTNARLADRGPQLRASLSIGGKSALEPRVFRNHFEHFDERLEEWAASSQRKNFVDSNVGPPGMISGNGVEHYLRNFNPVDYTLTFRGDTYHLRPVIAELRELWQKAATEASRLSLE